MFPSPTWQMSLSVMGLPQPTAALTGNVWEASQEHLYLFSIIQRLHDKKKTLLIFELWSTGESFWRYKKSPVDNLVFTGNTDTLQQILR